MLLVFSLSRWPGLMPANFSAAYALAFCAGLYFSPRMAWLAPLGAMLVTDLALNAYYGASFQWYQLGNYLGYALLIGAGQMMGSRTPWWRLVGTGLIGAGLFYLITNTLSWWLNPYAEEDYTRDFAGWLLALTKGTGGFPPTWMFLRNTLASGALFTGLFVGAAKWSEAAETSQEDQKETDAAKAPPEAVADASDAEEVPA